jgi:hypothetical protein
MNGYEPLGYLASLLVLTTFCMRDMMSLRAVAIASNVAFIVYGALAEISPVLLLHVVLLPVNLLRLAESVRSALRSHAEAAHCAPGCHARNSVSPPARETEPVAIQRMLSRISPPTLGPASMTTASGSRGLTQAPRTLTAAARDRGRAC